MTPSPKAEYEALSPEEIAEAKRLAKFYDKLVDSERAPLIARALRIAAAQEGQGAEPARLQFPTMLRKMWNGTEVQRWIDEQGPLYAAPPPAPGYDEGWNAAVEAAAKVAVEYGDNKVRRVNPPDLLADAWRMQAAATASAIRALKKERG